MLVKMLFISMIVSTGNAIHEKTLLSNVDLLVLKKGEMTSGRRASPVMQLTCQKNCYHTPDVVTCKNVGLDDKDVVWDCSGDMDDGVKFGVMDVTCEGYDYPDYPDDPYILTGSCGLTYSLTPHPNKNIKYDIYDTKVDKWEGVSGTILIIVLVVLVLSVCPEDTCGYPGYGMHPGYRGHHYRYRDSTHGFWSGAAVGAAGASAYNSGWGSGRSSGWGSGRSSGRSSGWGSSSRSDHATTSRS